MDGISLPAESASFQPTIVDETSPPEHDAEGSAVFSRGKDNNTKKGKKLFERKEQVPIEELYDLSKPIKRVSDLVSMLILLRSRYFLWAFVASYSNNNHCCC
jgi:hypothetical protein